MCLRKTVCKYQMKNYCFLYSFFAVVKLGIVFYKRALEIRKTKPE